jgi:hypothetical protein
MRRTKFSLLTTAISIGILAACSRPPITDLATPLLKINGTASPAASQATAGPTPTPLALSPEATSVEVTVQPTFEGFPPTVTLVPATPYQMPSATLDVSRLVTQTPSVPQVCPRAGTVEPPKLAPASENFDQDYETVTLNFLNDGGDVEALRTSLQVVMYWFDAYTIDLTNDGVDEVIVIANKPHIFGCDGSTYTTLMIVEPLELYTPQIIGIVDMNLNGVPELVIGNAVGGQTQTIEFQILEWNGQSFKSLVAPEHIRSRFVDAGVWHGTIYMMGAKSTIEDIDGNGTLELVLNGGIPIIGGDAASAGPWRAETLVWAWNGEWFKLGSMELDPPAYRFQAAQDGDRLTVTGHYDDAIAVYERVIQDETLDWWSPERTEYNMAFFDGDPTEPPPPAPDPAERPRLSAYAAYRIMLIHAVRGEVTLAALDYEAIRQRYSKLETAHSYAQLATEFWTALQNTSDVAQACREVVAYATQHSDTVLEPLGPSYYGWANMSYSATDVCPFGR